MRGKHTQPGFDFGAPAPKEEIDPRMVGDLPHWQKEPKTLDEYETRILRAQMREVLALFEGGPLTDKELLERHQRHHERCGLYATLNLNRLRIVRDELVLHNLMRLGKRIKQERNWSTSWKDLKMFELTDSGRAAIEKGELPI